jgi:hypothetical protein
MIRTRPPFHSLLLVLFPLVMADRTKSVHLTWFRALGASLLVVRRRRARPRGNLAA